MSLELTPNKLVDNLNKNYKEIVGEALLGYYNFWKNEKDTIEMIREKNLQLLNTQDISYLLAEANINQYGKSFFANEVIRNIINMKLIIIYLKFVETNQFKGQDSNIYELEEGQKGGMPNLKDFLKIAVGILLMSLTNATNVANTVAVIGENYVVEIPINTENIPPKVEPPFMENFDPNEEAHKEVYSKQFRTINQFPEDKTIEFNINEKFKTDFNNKEIDIFNKNPINRIIMSNSFINSLIGSHDVNDKFTKILTARIDELNIEMRSLYTSMEDMCQSFIETKDPVLPIRLWELFNDAIIRNDELQKIKDKENELVEKKREQLFSEAGITNQIEEESIISSISSYFSWDKKTPPLEKVNTAITLELYKKSEESVDNQIRELGPKFKEEAIQIRLNERLNQFLKQESNTRDSINLEAYYSSICEIYKSYYVYNQTSGMLSLKNPARSRFHLKILVDNVIEYYEKIISEGISKFDERTGEVITDIPKNSERLENLKSLFEKAQAIRPILTQYDIKIAKHLADKDMFSTDVNDFFETITEMWLGIKNSIIEATQPFPMTAKKENIEIKRIEAESLINIKRQTAEFKAEETERMLKILQQNKSNTLSKQEYDVFQNWLNLNLEGMIKNPIQAGIRTTTSTLTEPIGEIYNNTISSIMSGVWGITFAGMSFISLAILFISVKSGCVGAVFKGIKRKIEGSQQVQQQHMSFASFGRQGQGQGQQTRLNNNNPVYQFGQTSSLNNNGLTGTSVNQADLDNLVRDIFRRGGLKYKRKHFKRKTRKNKKRKTKKLKNGKKRQSKIKDLLR
jgi:hypothetical protein